MFKLGERYTVQDEYWGGFGGSSPSYKTRPLSLTPKPDGGFTASETIQYSHFYGVGLTEQEAIDSLVDSIAKSMRMNQFFLYVNRNPISRIFMALL